MKNLEDMTVKELYIALTETVVKMGTLASNAANALTDNVTAEEAKQILDKGVSVTEAVELEELGDSIVKEINKRDS